MVFDRDAKTLVGKESSFQQLVLGLVTEKDRCKSSSPWIGQQFLRLISKVQAAKGKTEYTLLKIKIVWIKDAIKKVIRQPTEWGKQYSQVIYKAMDWYSEHIKKNSYNSIIKRQ